MLYKSSSEEPHNLTIKECSTVYPNSNTADQHKENSDRNYLHVLDQMMKSTPKNTVKSLLLKDKQN